MAGGSADAAAALVALDRLWALDSGDAVLLRAGRRARLRRAVRPGRPQRARHRPGRAGRAAPGRRGGAVVGGRAAAATGSPPRRSTAASTSWAGRARPQPPAPYRLVAFLGDPAATLAPLLHNDLQARRARPAPRAGRPARGRRGGRRAARHRERLRPDLRLPLRRRGLGRRGVAGALRADHPHVLVAPVPPRSPVEPRGAAMLLRGGAPMSNLLNLERVSKAYGVRPLLTRSRSVSRPGSGSASSAATATARPRCCG